jgi:hypothetical protein
MILVVVTVMDLLSKAFRLRLFKAVTPSIRRYDLRRAFVSA